MLTGKSTRMRSLGMPRHGFILKKCVLIRRIGLIRLRIGIMGEPL